MEFADEESFKEFPQLQSSLKFRCLPENMETSTGHPKIRQTEKSGEVIKFQEEDVSSPIETETRQK